MWTVLLIIVGISMCLRALLEYSLQREARTGCDSLTCCDEHEGREGGVSINYDYLTGYDDIRYYYVFYIEIYETKDTNEDATFDEFHHENPMNIEYFGSEEEKKGDNDLQTEIKSENNEVMETREVRIDQTKITVPDFNLDKDKEYKTTIPDVTVYNPSSKIPVLLPDTPGYENSMKTEFYSELNKKLQKTERMIKQLTFTNSKSPTLNKVPVKPAIKPRWNSSTKIQERKYIPSIMNTPDPKSKSSISNHYLACTKVKKSLYQNQNARTQKPDDTIERSIVACGIQQVDSSELRNYYTEDNNWKQTKVSHLAIALWYISIKTTTQNKPGSLRNLASNLESSSVSSGMEHLQISKLINHDSEGSSSQLDKVAKLADIICTRCLELTTQNKPGSLRNLTSNLEGSSSVSSGMEHLQISKLKNHDSEGSSSQPDKATICTKFKPCSLMDSRNEKSDLDSIVHLISQETNSNHPQTLKEMVQNSKGMLSISVPHLANWKKRRTKLTLDKTTTVQRRGNSHSS